MKTPTRKQTAKNTIGKDSRPKAEIPEIYIKIGDGQRTEYARAHIRVKGGFYYYLVWRDGDRIRDYYMGKRRNS